MSKDIKPANPNAASSAGGSEPSADERKTAVAKFGRKTAAIKFGRKVASVRFGRKTNNFKI